MGASLGDSRIWWQKAHSRTHHKACVVHRDSSHGCGFRSTQTSKAFSLGPSLDLQGGDGALQRA